MLWYTPSPEIAYGDMLTILSNCAAGAVERDMHRLGAEFMVAVVAMHMMRVWITGSYKKTAAIHLVHRFAAFGDHRLP